jgi:hypothetical protein
LVDLINVNITRPYSMDISAVEQWVDSTYSDTVGRKSDEFFKSRRLPFGKKDLKGEGNRSYFGFSQRTVTGEGGEKEHHDHHAFVSYHSEDMFVYEMASKTHREILKKVVVGCLQRKEQEQQEQHEQGGGEPGLLCLNWTDISEQLAQVCGKRYLPIECFIQYRNYLDPCVNRGKWLADEEARLIELAAKYKEHHWVAIASELGTLRTPIECLCHYQQFLNIKLFTTDDWTPAEERLLKSAAETVPGMKKDWTHIARKVRIML